MNLWKVNEFCQFLLYLCPDALHGILSDAMCANFMQLPAFTYNVLREVLPPLQLQHLQTRMVGRSGLHVNLR